MTNRFFSSYNLTTIELEEEARICKEEKRVLSISFCVPVSSILRKFLELVFRVRNPTSGLKVLPEEEHILKLARLISKTKRDLFYA